MDRVPVTIREVPAAAAIAARLPRGPARIEQRIVKEHLDQKYLLCGFAIHVIFKEKANKFSWVEKRHGFAVLVLVNRMCSS